MKKSLIAAAVASVCAAPMAAQADVNLWGEFIAGVQNDNEDAREVEGDGDMYLNLDSSNFGIESSEDLGNGMSVEAGTELAIGGASPELGFDNTYAALSGDFGSLLAGWGVDSAFYLHVLEPTDVGEVLGGYLAFGESGYSDAADNALQYGYDGGAFQLTAEVQMQPEDDVELPTTPATTAAAENTETFDKMALGATFDAGVVTIGVGHELSSVADNTDQTGGDAPAEPSMTGFSVGGGFGGFDLGASYVMFDTDSDADEGTDPTALDLNASTDFGGGLGGLVGVGMYDADNDDDADNMTGFHVQLSQSLSSNTMVFGQLQSQSIDGGDAGEDTDPQSVFVGVSHAF
ncbi:MAG: porin [Halofilum sp. (in: g-proteobacteria)]